MPVLTKINTNSIAEDAITGDKFAGDAYLANTANQNISGTYSENRLYTSDAYTLSGNATVNSHLTLSSVKPTADVVLTAGGAYTLTGTGVLSGGSLVAKVNTDLTEMTGELGSVVTGSPNIILSTTKSSDGAEGVKTNELGYVTKPNIPAFSVKNSAIMNLASGGANYIMAFDDVTNGVNNGGHFNLANYHFYPPIAGLYYFNVCLTFASSSVTGRYCRGRIVKNDSVILVNAHNHVSDESGNDDYHGVAGTCITPLVVGDYIYVHVAEVTANTYLPTHMSNFVGWLLG